ncbi:1,4-dihydroxy-6-naphthoate synthase [Geomesophilobacter sediminis]|uniref:1,4-dihydroxy-6-naphtoate synthase n=1 Tax=Geomesophilobacter sediminis TaxID=2798584 RepID=A0A8J7M170_9BACT|nr:1,4-dihydroxy-6-naphthoate synthase [Geomesophilobacter sediminis]MBJ6726624.1 1,4-dihydroxy-6-naphthoate synthase [Geomesophilobacter sediminis]
MNTCSTNTATPLTLGFSPCPNDTFIFHALIHGLVDAAGLRFTERLEDVETLNRLALDRALDVSKVSYHLMGRILPDYVLLRSGGALGRGCGPLLVARADLDPSRLAGKKIALPGRYTTAALLLRLYDPTLTDFVYLPFHEIMGAVADGSVDAGVIIHESRFTYASYGLTQLLDLGAWWEADTGHPIPLGGIAAKRSLGGETLRAIEDALTESVRHAFAHPALPHPYIRAHSQEMSEAVCDAHIKLYVNDFSLTLGSEGEQAVQYLLQRATAAGIIPPSSEPLFTPR